MPGNRKKEVGGIRTPVICVFGVHGVPIVRWNLKETVSGIHFLRCGKQIILLFFTHIICKIPQFLHKAVGFYLHHAYKTVNKT